MKTLGYSLLAIFLLLFMMIFRPVPQPSSNNTFILEDKVVNVFEGPSYDIVFVLDSSAKMPYINRGLERGLSIDSLNMELKGNRARFKIINH